MLGKRARDVQRCLRNIDSFSDRQASVVAWDSELLRWLKLCVRPRGGPYRGGSFHFEIGFKKHYPKYAPVVSCLTPIYHPNIDPEVEEFNVCVSLLDQWSESYGLEDVVQALLYLMYHPNLNDPLSSLFEVGLDYETFAREVRISLHGGTVVGMRFPKMVEENAEEDEAIVREFVGDRKSPRSLTDMVSGIVQDVLEKVSSSPLPGLLPSQPQLQPMQAPVTAPLDPSTVTGPEDTVVEGVGEGGEACAVGLDQVQDKDSELQERIYSTMSALTDKIIAQKEKLAKDLEEQEAAMQRTQGQGQCSEEKSEESDEAGTASEEEVCEESAAMVAGLLTNLSLQMECLTLIGESLELNDIEGEGEGVTEQNDDSGEGETLSEQLSKALSKAREYGGGGNALAEQLAKALLEQEQLFGSLMERREHLRRRGREVGPSERGDAREHSSNVLPEPEIESGPVSEPRERGDGSQQHGALSTSATRENGAYVLQEPITEPQPEQRVRNSLAEALSHALSERNRRMEADAVELSGSVSELRKGDESGEKTTELTVESGAVSELRKVDQSAEEMTESVAESERRDEPSEVQHAFANALFSAMTANSRRRHNDAAVESTTIRGSTREEKTSSDPVPEHREVPSESRMIGERLEFADDIERELEAQQSDSSSEVDSLEEESRITLAKLIEFGGEGNVLAEELAKLRSSVFGLPQQGALSDSASRENSAYVSPTVEPRGGDESGEKTTESETESESVVESGAVSEPRRGSESGEKTESDTESEIESATESATESVSVPQRRDEPSDVQHAFANALFSAMAANSRPRWSDTSFEPVTVPFPRPPPTPASARTTSLLSSLLSSSAMGPCHPVGGSRAPVESTTNRGSAGEEKASESGAESVAVSEPSRWGEIGEKTTESVAEHRDEPSDVQHAFANALFSAMTANSRRRHNDTAVESTTIRGSVGEEKASESVAESVAVSEPSRWGESGEKTTESVAESEQRVEPSDVQHAFANALFSAMTANSRRRHNDAAVESTTIRGSAGEEKSSESVAESVSVSEQSRGDEIGEKTTESVAESEQREEPSDVQHAFANALFSAMTANSRRRHNDASVESTTIRGSPGEEKSSEVGESVAVSEPSRWGEIGEKTTESVAESEQREEPSDVQHAFANTLFSAMTANSRRRHNDAAVESTTIRGSAGEEKASESVAESVAVSEPSRWGEIGEKTTESVAESEPSRGNESPREEPSDMQHALANALFSAMAANSRRHNNAAAESTSISGSSGDTAVTFSGPIHWENMPRLPASRRTTSALTSAAATCSCHPRRQRRAEEFERVTGLLDELLQATREETEAVEAAIEARRRGEGVSAMVAQYEVQSERSQRVLESIQSTLDSLIPGSTTPGASNDRNTNPSSNAVTSTSMTNTRNTNTNFGIRPPPLYHLHNCNIHQHFRANMGRNDAGTPPENSTPDIPIPEILERVEAMLQSIAENGEPNEDLLPSDSDTYFTEDEEEEDDEDEDVDDADFFRRMTRYRGEDDDDDGGNDYVVVPRPPTPPRGSRRNRDNEAPVEEQDMPLWSIPIFVAIVASHIIDLTGMFAL